METGHLAKVEEKARASNPAMREPPEPICSRREAATAHCHCQDTHEVLGGGLWGPEAGPRAWLLALLPPLLLRATSAGLSATTEL